MINSPAEADGPEVESPETGEGRRHIYIVAAVATSFLTKFAPLGPLTCLARYYGHDLALAILGYMILRPQVSRLSSGLIIFGGCAAAEVLQLVIKETPARRLPFLGTFDWWDFAAYGAGIAVAVLLEITTLDNQLTKANTDT